MSTNNIKKFAKYGLVLVAAITIATAAQSQQGNVSHRVYAEEVSQPDYDSWRMFYVYSADAPDSPTSGSMAGRVIKPDDPYIVGDESFRDPGTYSRYEVFDDTGKHYNPGDTITVGDPLVNHANEEDNRLYYYYYMNPGSSETPAPNPGSSETASKDHAAEKPSQKADDKNTATDKAEKAKADKKADSKKADDKKVEKSKDTTSEKTVAAKDNSASKTAETSVPAEQAKATVKANANENSQAIVKEADGTVDTAAVHNDNNGGAILTMLGLVSAAFIGLFKNKKEEK